MQRNSVSWDIKGIDESGYIEGLAAGFGNVDFGGDRIIPGAFTKSLDGRKTVPMLLFHDQHRPIGVWSEFKEIDDGLLAKGRITTKTRDGGEAYELAKDGALSALSIGYEPTVKRMAGKVRELVELALHEVSLVSIGMNPKALITGVKEIEDLRNRLAAGDRLTEREWEGLFKQQFGLSNNEAERAVRIHGLKIGQGEPDAETEAVDFLTSLMTAMQDAPVFYREDDGSLTPLS